MPKPKLTRKRVILAFSVAVVADALELPITAAEDFTLGTLAIPAEGADVVLDCVVMAIMTKLLGFHWLFLPSFLVETIPEVDLLPTWVGCVAYVAWERKKEQATLEPAPVVVDVHAAETDAPPQTPSAAIPPRLAAGGRDDVLETRPQASGSSFEKRLASLVELRNKGLISEVEFDSLRQRILAEITKGPST